MKSMVLGNMYKPQNSSANLGLNLKSSMENDMKNEKAQKVAGYSYNKIF